MKRYITCCLVLSLCFCCVSGCGFGSKANDTGAPVSSSQGEAQSLSITTVLPAGTAIVDKMPVMVDMLNENGLFESALYPDSQLGSCTDMLDRCFANDPIVNLCDPADFCDMTVPEASAMEMPFLVQTYEQLDKIYQSDWWKGIKEQVAEKGLMILSENGRTGDRHILTKTPVESLSDLKGLKIRVPTNVAFVAGFTALGCSPTPMAVSEIYTSLQQGVIDGLEHPYADILSRKTYEVAKYCVEQPHMRQPNMSVCGTGFYNGLSEEQKTLLKEAGDEAFNQANDYLEELDEQCKQELEKAGVTFTQINTDEFIEAAKGFFEYPDMQSWTPGLYDTLLEIVNS
ncbi:MAG: TRAP transporter substrate-binding protein DctP [Eubacteriales bacterium]